jgi:Metalloenzyme superfamily
MALPLWDAPMRRMHRHVQHPPVQVCILDGFGYNTEDKYNGIHMAETPVYDSLRKNEERFRCTRGSNGHHLRMVSTHVRQEQHHAARDMQHCQCLC